MVNVLRSFKGLAQQAEELGFQPEIDPGSVFWLENRHLVGPGLEFAPGSERDRHPVVVVANEDGYTDIRVMTSKVKEYLRRGTLYIPGAEVRLTSPSVILTRDVCHQRVPAKLLRQTQYLGNVGPEVLLRIWVTETLRELSKEAY